MRSLDSSTRWWRVYGSVLFETSASRSCRTCCSVRYLGCTHRFQLVVWQIGSSFGIILAIGFPVDLSHRPPISNSFGRKHL